MELLIEVALPVIVGLSFYLVIDLISDIISLFNKKKWVSNVRNSQLVRETILFTNDILYQKGIKHFPSFKISYYPHKKFFGVYNDSNIIIYVKNATDAVSIVRITLHEVSHYIQHHTKTSEFSKYEYYSEKYGYDENPLEKESYEFADKWTQPCLNYLLKRNVVKLR